MLPVPAQLSLPSQPIRLSWWARLIWLSVSLGCLAVFVTALRVQPDPSGIGSHESLGLAPCQFAWRTGLPCPSCGMTTSFAWFVRGRLLASFYVQPMGFLLAIFTGFFFWIGLYLAVTGKSAARLVRMLPARGLLVAFFSIMILAWAWKIFIHLRGIDGWH